MQESLSKIPKKTLIKFCGLFRECDIDFANALLPDFAGFVFAKSPRQVDFFSAKILKNRLDSRILSVGVFVDSSISEVVRVAKMLDFIQLHGSEDCAYIAELRAKTSAKIIKAISAKSTEAILESMHTNADFVLLDNLKGGSGEKFDWENLKIALESHEFQRAFSQKYFLAGGLNAQNLAQAIKFRPFALDISSGIETDGAKDFAKMREVMAIFKRF